MKAMVANKRRTDFRENKIGGKQIETNRDTIVRMGTNNNI